MLLSVVFIILGFLLLIKGADWLVNGASTLARKHNVSDLAIGLTIVAFGTSAPELVVNTFASAQNHSDIVFGNIIGSNIFNLLAILGIVALIAPIRVQSTTVWKEIPMSLLAAIMLLLLCNTCISSDIPMLSRLDAVILLVLFIFFLLYVYKQMLAEKNVNKRTEEITMSNWKIWGLIVVGLSGLVIGGKLVVNSAVNIATVLGVSEKVIALTIVAAGTSLPELMTSVVAALKKNSDIAIGNIVGSNIFNIFFILSVSGLIRPIPYDTLYNTDLYILIIGTIFLFVCMFTGKKKRLDRWEGSIMLIAYVIYTLFLIKRG